MCLTPLIKNIISHNNLADGNYAEPYCGGAGIGLELLAGELVKTIYLNDVDYRIYAFWSSIIYYTEGFLRLLRDTSINIDEWRHQKKLMNDFKNNDILSVGFATFYLNRSNRSGILNAGPIGGYKQNGNWKLSARFSKSELTKRILFLSNYSNRIKLSNYDALIFLDYLETDQIINKRLLVYLDPPYYSKGDQLYFDYYTPEDHKQLAKYIKVSNLNWVLSYDNVKQIRNLYRGLPMKCTTLTYHAQTVKEGRELIVFHPNLDITDTII